MSMSHRQYTWQILQAVELLDGAAMDASVCCRLDMIDAFRKVRYLHSHHIGPAFRSGHPRGHSLPSTARQDTATSLWCSTQKKLMFDSPVCVLWAEENILLKGDSIRPWLTCIEQCVTNIQTREDFGRRGAGMRWGYHMADSPPPPPPPPFQKKRGSSRGTAVSTRWMQHRWEAQLANGMHPKSSNRQNQ